MSNECDGMCEDCTHSADIQKKRLEDTKPEVLLTALQQRQLAALEEEKELLAAELEEVKAEQDAIEEEIAALKKNS